MQKLHWAKAVSDETHGQQIETALHKAGIVDRDTLKNNKTLAARIIAQEYSSEVHQLLAWAESPASVPVLAEPPKKPKKPVESPPQEG